MRVRYCVYICISLRMHAMISKLNIERFRCFYACWRVVSTRDPNSSCHVANKVLFDARDL